MTQGELLARITSEELSEWLAFDREYGLPDAYFLAASLGPAILAPYAKKAPKAEDFVPLFAPPKQKQTTADHLNFFRSISRQARV